MPIESLMPQQKISIALWLLCVDSASGKNDIAVLQTERTKKNNGIVFTLLIWLRPMGPLDDMGEIMIFVDHLSANEKCGANVLLPTPS